MSNFYNQYTALCAKHGFTPSGAAAAIGLSNAAASGWKRGKMPSDVNLAKLAALFNCTIEDLTNDKEEPTTVVGDELSDDQRLLIEKLLAMSPEELEKKLPAIRVILEL